MLMEMVIVFYSNINSWLVHKIPKSIEVVSVSLVGSILCKQRKTVVACFIWFVVDQEIK